MGSWKCCHIVMHSWKCYIDICAIQVYYYCYDNDDDDADDYKTKKKTPKK